MTLICSVGRSIFRLQKGLSEGGKKFYSSDPHFSWRIPTVRVDPAGETSRPHVLDSTNSVADRKSEDKSDRPRGKKRLSAPTGRAMRKMQRRHVLFLPRMTTSAADTSAPFRPGLRCGACTRQANNRIRLTMKGSKDNTNLSLRVQ
jgi:hypothetical protein